jgi:hypothetical protein
MLPMAPILGMVAPSRKRELSSRSPASNREDGRFAGLWMAYLNGPDVALGRGALIGRGA